MVVSGLRFLCTTGQPLLNHLIEQKKQSVDMWVAALILFSFTHFMKCRLYENL